MAGAEVEEAYESLAGWAAQKGQREIITALMMMAEYAALTAVVNHQSTEYEKLKKLDAEIVNRLRVADRIIALSKANPPA